MLPPLVNHRCEPPLGAPSCTELHRLAPLQALGSWQIQAEATAGNLRDAMRRPLRVKAEAPGRAGENARRHGGVHLEGVEHRQFGGGSW